jgi:hypothetical protein
VYCCQRAYPLNPYEVAEVAERRCISAMAAARLYLKWDLHLPGDLDGWKVQ